VGMPGRAEIWFVAVELKVIVEPPKKAAMTG
jgi:hypothetical protein